MRESLLDENKRYHQILSEAHLQALDRRVWIILEQVQKCFEQQDKPASSDIRNIVIDDRL